MRVALFLVLLTISAVSCTFNFLVMGDWGGQNNPYGGTSQAREQSAVAAEMGIIGSQYNAKFVLNVGDNFYADGVANVSDPLFNIDFRNVYTASSLQVPWITMLGNHDYAGNVSAELLYTGDPRWVLPSRYYTQEITITSSGDKATLLVIDSNPISYNCPSNNPNTCTGGDPNTVQFWTNVLSQNWTPQINWIQSTLAATTNDWIIVAGHHPNYWIDEYSNPYITDVFNQYGVAAYYCGHVHDMEHFMVDYDVTDYFISGAGSLAKDFPGYDVPCNQCEETENEKRRARFPMRDEWESKSPGFAVVSFDDSASKMTTTFFDYLGNNLNSFVTTRPSGRAKKLNLL